MPATHAATHAISIGRRYGHPQQSDAWKPPATHAAWLDGHPWKTSCGRTIHVDDVARGGEKSALADGAKPTCRACRKLRSASTRSA